MIFKYMETLFVSFQALKNQLIFFRNTKTISAKKVGTALLLSLFVLLAETLGLASLYPIISFLEQGQDLSLFEKSSGLNSIFIRIYDFFDLEISLISLMLATAILVLLRQIANYFFAFYNEGLKWSVGVSLGKTVLRKMLNSKASHVNSTSRGDLIASIDYECQAIATIIIVYIMLFQLMVSFLSYFSLSIFTAPLPTLVSLTVLFLVGISLGFLVKKINKFSKDSVLVRKSFISLISEVYGAWKLIKINNAEEYEINRFVRVGQRLVDLRVSMIKTSSLIETIFIPVITILLLFCVYVMVEVLDYPIASIMIFLAAMMRMMPMAQNFQKRFAQLAQYDPSLDKIRYIIDQADLNFESANTGQSLEKIKFGIKLSKLSFAHPNSESKTIDNVDAFIPVHTITAIVGRSGSGKSTLIDLISGIHVPSGGCIEIDNVDLSQLSLSSFRKKIAVVSQDTFLFNLSIFENLVYGNESVSNEEIHAAINAVDLDDFINSLSDGLNTQVFDGATNMSGGQKQRLAIIRAILKKADILILDEPTSAVDQSTEALILAELSKLVKMKRLTVIMVSHNDEILKNSDNVLVMENGKMKSFGPLKNSTISK